MDTQIVTKDELSKHTKDGDLWVLVDGKVYDVSEYMEDHPGGKEILLDHSGAKDASLAYEDADHSKRAREMVTKYLVGTFQE